MSRHVQCSVKRAVQGNTWGSAGTQRGYLLQERGKKAAGQRRCHPRSVDRPSRNYPEGLGADRGNRTAEPRGTQEDTGQLSLQAAGAEGLCGARGGVGGTRGDRMGRRAGPRHTSGAVCGLSPTDQRLLCQDVMRSHL